MTLINTNPEITATAREAGRNVVHEVKLRGETVPYGTRRSAHRYGYAICCWYRIEGESRLVVKRWSRNAKCSGPDFAVPVEEAA